MSDHIFTSDEISLFLEEIKVGVLVLEGDSHIAFANSWFLNAARQTTSEISGRNLEDVFPGKISTRLSSAIGEAINDRRATLLTTKLNKSLFPLVTSSGSEMQQRITIKPFGDDKEIQCCLIQIEDVTDNFERETILKQKRKEVEEDRAYLNAILQSTAEGIVTINHQGIIETFNIAAETMFGYSADEAIGHNVSMLIPDKDRKDHQGYIENSNLHAPRIINQARELFGFRKDESTFPLELNVSRMEISGRTVFIGLMRDITAQKEVDRMKNEFVSTVSHELRTPLTSIKGSLGLLALGTFGPLTEEMTALLTLAQKNSDRLVNLVNDILDVDKLESGTLEFLFITLDLSKLVADAIETNKGFASELGVEFILADVVPDIMVSGDSSRLNQVIANLLSNAAKFSPEGQEVKISVSADGDTAKISVADHGPGIPVEFRDHIFKRFAQVDGSDIREKGGSGLGLNISKSIVESHDGKIDYTSEIGVGSTFYFTLPILK